MFTLIRRQTFRILQKQEHLSVSSREIDIVIFLLAFNFYISIFKNTLLKNFFGRKINQSADKRNEKIDIFREKT